MRNTESASSSVYGSRSPYHRDDPIVLLPDESSFVKNASTGLYHCPWQDCPAKYNKQSRIGEHIRSHSNERPFVCEWQDANGDVCGKAFLRKGHLETHERVHGSQGQAEKPFVCSAMIPRDLWLSRRRAELGVKMTEQHRMRALLDPEELAQIGHLDETSSSHLVSTQPGEAILACQVPCGKRFWTDQHLKRHQKTHVEEGHYACPSCPSVFGKAKELKKHMCTHAEPNSKAAKAYACPEEHCSQTFDHPSRLERHAKVHKRRYICEHVDCQAQPPEFPVWSELRTHVAQVHGKGTSRQNPKGTRDKDRRQKQLDEKAARGMSRKQSRWSRKAALELGASVKKRKRDDPKAEAVADADELSESSAPLVDAITGMHKRTTPGNAAKRTIECPFSEPDMAASEDRPPCRLKFSQARDLRKHLKSIHQMEVDD